MLTVTRHHWGTTALDRMVRDGILTPVDGAHALMPEVAHHPDARAGALRHAVPRHVAVTGSAALWIACLLPRPGVLTLVGPRGLHRPMATPQGDAWPRSFHSRRGWQAGCTVHHGVRVAAPAQALVDAARWEPAAVALQAAVGTAARIEDQALETVEWPSVVADKARVASLLAAAREATRPYVSNP